jgi:Nitroreductase
MNEVIKALNERRSIRHFKPEAVDDESLEAIIKAGLHAPSARGSQAVHITAVLGLENIARLNAAVKAATVKPGFDKYAGMADQPGYSINFHQAPVFIIVSVDPQASFCPPEDGALVLGNILLAAHALGLGACWVNQLGPICDEPGFRQVLTEFGLPPAGKIIGCAAIGHRAGDNPKASARKPGRVNIVR